MRMPEEINRILTDRISRWLFTPTEAATRHLRGEGAAAERIEQVGDVMYDVALHHGARASEAGGALQRLDMAPGSYGLAPTPRDENTAAPHRLRPTQQAPPSEHRRV